ncbi:MAG: hypothetical protein NC200_03000 [Candidatus Gastranaerophilales bacterium]|nr:hypothetical protein [Candidatus Gastranaerophilales bacterium]
MKNKNFKNFILTGLVALTLTVTVPTIVTAEVKADTPVSSVQKTLNLGDFATKQPIGTRQIAMKFILAMLGVAASSVVIFVLLSIYNKFMYGANVNTQNETDNDFKTPANMKDAINIFLKKTK